MNQKITVLFPGIGYRFERPLLYFAKKQAKQYGYTILENDYHGFPDKIRGDQERLKESVKIACEQTETNLKEMNWNTYQSIVFVSKSIGTIAAAQYAYRHQIKADQILFTPFPDTFSVPINGNSIGFHAVEDPWMKHQEVVNAAEKAGVPLIIYPKGNHSLETGNVNEDIRILEDIFAKTKEIFE